MRIAALVIIAALAAGCQSHRYFVDLDRAVAASYDGKKAQAEIENAGAQLQRKADDAAAAAKKAEDEHDKNAAAVRQGADDTAKQVKATFEQYRAATLNKLGVDVRGVLDRIAADRRVALIDHASSVAWFDPSFDVTAEVTRRLDANSSRKELDELRAKADAKDKKAKP